MKNELTGFCKKLSSSGNILPILKKLNRFYFENNMPNEQMAALKMIWHITKNHKLLIEAGDIASQALGNYNLARSLYDLYMQKTSPFLYSRYLYINNSQSGSQTFGEFDNTDYFSDYIKLKDRYFALMGILVYFNKVKQYDDVACVMEFLDIINEKLRKYLEKHTNNKEGSDKEIEDNKKYLSEILSKTDDNIDINKIAIRLNPKNEQAYLNILNIYIKTEKFDDALNFYNLDFKTQFETKKSNSTVDLFWNISQRYSNNEDYYKSVFYQKLAIEKELDNKK